MILPLNGQKQASTGRTWQTAVTLTPLLSIAVQCVQCDPIAALAGTTSSAALKSMAPRLPNKSIFFFT